MSVPSESRLAGGTINIMTFLQPNPGVVLGCLQCSGPGVPIIGVCAEFTSNMMGTVVQTQYVPQGFPAAVSGGKVRVYEMLERCMVIVASGHTVMPDDLLISDASGYAQPLPLATAGVHWIGARAIEAGVAGSPIRAVVYTVPYTKNA